MEIFKTLETWYGNGGITVTVVGILVIIIAAFLLDKLICRLTDHGIGDVAQGENNRRLTLRRVIRSVTHYVVAFIALVMILAKLGVNVVSIMAAAGVLGLAVSFGAQSLIKDIFAGFFIIFEDQYGVGEYITVNGTFTGFVELVGLRTTQLKGDSGEMIVIPNGSITDVVNYCRGDLRIKELFEISFDSDIDRAEAVIAAAAAAYYKANTDKVTKPPTVEGVELIGQSGVSVCIFVYVQPMEKWRVGRDMRKVIVQALQKEGITIPYPVTEVITKVEKDGN